jgi:hypothetical protein
VNSWFSAAIHVFSAAILKECSCKQGVRFASKVCDRKSDHKRSEFGSYIQCRCRTEVQTLKGELCYIGVSGSGVSLCVSSANNRYYSYILGEPNTSQSVIYYTNWL